MRDLFEEEGAICLKNILSLEMIEKLRTGVEKNLSHPSPYSESLSNTMDSEGAVFFNDYCNWMNIEEFRHVIFDSFLPQIAAQLVRSNKINFYHEHVLVKEPGSSRKTPWHHDQPYYPIDGFQSVSFWIPLDPINKEENSVRYISGSHKWGKWFIPRKFATLQNYVISKEENDFEEKNYEQLIDNTLDTGIENGRYKILNWDMEPGDLVAFHYLTLHGAPGNQTLNRRRVVALRFTGDDIRITLKRPWQVSPPITANKEHGEELDSETFPVVYMRQSLH